MKIDSGKRKAFTSNPRINHKVAILKRVTGKRNTTVTIALLGGVAVTALATKLAVFLVPGLAPADVLNKAPRPKEEGLHGIEAYNIDMEDVASNMAGGGI